VIEALEVGVWQPMSSGSHELMRALVTVPHEQPHPTLVLCTATIQLHLPQLSINEPNPARLVDGEEFHEEELAQIVIR
jgi:hypothetical protein